MVLAIETVLAFGVGLVAVYGAVLFEHKLFAGALMVILAMGVFAVNSGGDSSYVTFVLGVVFAFIGIYLLLDLGGKKAGSELQGFS